jgi:mycothiol synthase
VIVSCAPGTGTPRLDVARRLTPELQQRIRGLAARAQQDDGVRPFGEHKWLRLIRGDDRFVALLLWCGAHLVGAAHCYAYHTSAPGRPCRLTAEMVVDPTWRGRGLGRELLEAIIERARDEGADDVQLWAYGDLSEAQRLAQQFGFGPERILLQEELPAQRLPSEPPRPPEGIRVRTFEAARDAYTWLALHNHTFAEHPEQSTWDASDLQARFEQPWFDAGDFFIGEDATTAEMLGFCWVKLPTDSAQPGEIYIVGVAPGARGRGLGRYLTQLGLAHMRQRERPGGMLYVEADNERALAMYAALGFEVRWRHVCYAALRQRLLSRATTSSGGIGRAKK